MRVSHTICNEPTVRHLSISARHFEGPPIPARVMAAQSGKVDNEADGLTEGKLEGRCCVLPGRDGDCGNPFVQWLRRVGMLGEEGVDLSTDCGFPVGVHGDVEENPAGWGSE